MSQTIVFRKSRTTALGQLRIRGVMNPYQDPQQRQEPGSHKENARSGRGARCYCTVIRTIALDIFPTVLLAQNDDELLLQD